MTGPEPRCRCIYRAACPKHGDQLELVRRLDEIVELCHRVDTAFGGSGQIRTETILEIALDGATIHEGEPETV